MQDEKIEWGKEVVQFASEVSDAAKDAGIPGIGLIGKFAQTFYAKRMKSRFEDFCKNAEIDEDLINRVQDDEGYSNCLYSALETVRRTHSKIGLTALALLYKDYWNNEKILIPAMRAFAEISDQTILAFIELYESIPEGKDYIILSEVKDGETVFHHSYPEAVELINRNVFMQSAYTSMHANMPIQGTRFDHTDLYYKYCVEAIKRV
jgi:hypothetical protein